MRDGVTSMHHWLNRSICVAFMYAICGAISGLYLLTSEIQGEFSDPRFYMVPLPFAILSLIILRPTTYLFAPWPIVLSVFVWLSAYVIAVETTLASASMILGVYLPACSGGLIGGAGAAAVFGIWRQNLHRPLSIWGAAFVGCLAALPFGPVETWLRHNPVQMSIGFAIWQASVGTYAYLTSRYYGESER